jgi:hypothetical protein
MAHFFREKVERITLRPGIDGCVFSLQNTAVTKDNYFVLENNHPHYKELYSLLLMAAANRLWLEVRTESDVTPAESGKVAYLNANW